MIDTFNNYYNLKHLNKNTSITILILCISIFDKIIFNRLSTIRLYAYEILI